MPVVLPASRCCYAPATYQRQRGAVLDTAVEDKGSRRRSWKADWRLLLPCPLSVFDKTLKIRSHNPSRLASQKLLKVSRTRAPLEEEGGR